MALKTLRTLQEELGVTYRTLNRVVSERQIERLHKPGMRDTWVDEDAVRAAFAEPQRRPERRKRTPLEPAGEPSDA